MNDILSFASTSIHAQRMRIALDADAKQDSVANALIEHGPELAWSSILEGEYDPERIRRAIIRQLRALHFDDTIQALAINGTAIAAWTQRENERLAGIAAAARIISLAEPSTYTPSAAIRYWQRFLGLSDEQADNLVPPDTRAEAAKIADRIAAQLMDRLAALHRQTVDDGLPLSDFIKQAREIAPDASRSLLETEYRTHMATVYGQQLREQISARANAFPFMQFMIVNDNRTTWWICLPMGTAGPNGTGYICATDDPITIKWRTPAHFRCRSMWSPISYREAQRYGILAADGRTKIARVGNNPDRPYGDPPKIAENPNGNGDVRRVAPQEGFGG